MRKPPLRAPVLLLSAASLVFLAVALRPRPEAPERASLAGPAPDFRLAELGGRVVSLSEYRGRVVLLNFWATWCESCTEEMPLLETLHRRYRERGLAVLAPSIDAAGRRAVLPFVARHSPTFPVLLSDLRTAQAYEVIGLPTAYLIDARGRVARKYVGPLDPLALENDILRELGRKG